MTNLTPNLERYHRKLEQQSQRHENLNNFQIITFYKFVDPKITSENLSLLRDKIYNYLKTLNILGTVLIANEGINGTICGITRDVLDKAFSFIQSQEELGQIFGKYSLATFNPFKKLKIKVRPEIVTMGMGEIDVINLTGTHVNARQWNELLQDPDTVVIDTRNDFEYKMGTFKNSVNPDTKYFRDLPEYIENNLNPDNPENKNKKIAMFCTGGVRCEKSTAYLKQLGFENVYQLNGGILNYFEEITPEESMWEGRCFIFDDRIAVNQQLEPVGIPEDYVDYGRRDLMPKDEEY